MINLVAANGEVILTSPAHATRESALAAIPVITTVLGRDDAVDEVLVVEADGVADAAARLVAAIVKRSKALPI